MDLLFIIGDSSGRETGCLGGGLREGVEWTDDDTQQRCLSVFIMPVLKPLQSDLLSLFF